jgi:hypothetical protein
VMRVANQYYIVDGVIYFSKEEAQAAKSGK